MTPKQIAKQHEALIEVSRKKKEMMRELTDNIMRELEILVKKNGGSVTFKHRIDFDKWHWSTVAYSILFFDYEGWDDENNCSEHHVQLCLDERSNLRAGIPCISNNPKQDTLYSLEYWAKCGNKTGLLYHVYEATLEALGKK